MKDTERETDRQTDRQTHDDGIYRISIASRGKKSVNEDQNANAVCIYTGRFLEKDGIFDAFGWKCWRSKFELFSRCNKVIRPNGCVDSDVRCFDNI